MNSRAFEELSTNLPKITQSYKILAYVLHEFQQGYTPGIKFKVSEALRTF